MYDDNPADFVFDASDLPEDIQRIATQEEHSQRRPRRHPDQVVGFLFPQDW